MNSEKKALLIITGSIAAFKSLELIRLLVKAGISVEGVLTEAGSQFVTPLSVETLTGKQAHHAMWNEDAHRMLHIELSRRADIIVVAPATADFISKTARGIGDDLASSIMLANDKPIIFAPSMNVEMWENPSFARNLQQVEKDGARIVPPQKDMLACGEVGIGKMAEPQAIFEAIDDFFERGSQLAGSKAIVTAGGTIERIDSVRYISNFSSGKQGFAIAKELANRGATVTLIVGNASAPPPRDSNIEFVSIESALQMKDAVDSALPADIFIGCAAVADFRVANQSTQKIKKENGLELSFAKNPDIIASIGQLPKDNRPHLVIGFAAETNDLEPNARKKLESKACDLVVANDVSEGAVFGKDQNKPLLVSKSETTALGSMSKDEVARTIADWISTNRKS